MNVDDPRHGSYAGAVEHWQTGTPICTPCGTAAYRYVKKNRLERAEGNPRTVPILGTRRRIRALCALGYSYNQIGVAMGSDRRHVQIWAARESKTTVLRSTAERVAEVYEQLAMRVPDNSNNRLEYFRTMARRKHWAPPLAWDDIDDPDEQPTGAGRSSFSSHDSRTSDAVDPSRVDRIINGDWHLPCTRAEKEAVCATWIASGRSLRQLERHTGWNSARYVSKEAA